MSHSLPRTFRFLALACVLLAGGPSAAHLPGKSAYDQAKARNTPFGRPADPRKAQREIQVEMRDTMRFVPEEITVQRGETVRFVARNTGEVMHEMVLGTRKDLEQHAAMMKKHPAMEHDEPNMLHVPPGQTGEMGWRFTRAGEFYFGCLVPGHFEAGMVGKITVTEAAR